MVESGLAGNRLCSIISAYFVAILPLTNLAGKSVFVTIQNSEYMGSEGYALIGAAFEVHSELGGGMSEEIYQESFELELGFRSIDFIPKGELQLYYKGRLLEKKYYPDLLVSREIVTELKAVKALNAAHERQLLNYMRITKKAVGYVVNFGPLEKLEWKRFILREYVPDQP
jgi:GxxExxY protein